MLNMINRQLPVLVLIFALMLTASAKEISSAKVKALNGRTIDTKTFVDGKRPVLIVFFAICCNPSLNALEDIHDSADDLIDEHDLKIIFISVDDTRNSRKVAPLLKSKGYDYDIYLDENGDFRRAMGVNDRPYYILFDSTGNSIYERAGYMVGVVEEITTALGGNINAE